MKWLPQSEELSPLKTCSICLFNEVSLVVPYGFYITLSLFWFLSYFFLSVLQNAFNTYTIQSEQISSLLVHILFIGKLPVQSFKIYPTVSYNLFSYYVYLSLLHSPLSRFFILGYRELVLFVLLLVKFVKDLEMDQDIMSSVEHWALSRLPDSMGSLKLLLSLSYFTLLLSYIILTVMQRILVHRNTNSISLGFSWLLPCVYWAVLKFYICSLNLFHHS